MKEPAPPYVGEGPRALWHVSEDDSLDTFVPHLRPEHDAEEPLVWAVDTRHQPLYWFPRDCPRATCWARSTRVVAYWLPDETFAPRDRFWVSRATVVPVDLLELGDLVERHEHAGIDLRVDAQLLTLWDDVLASTLDCSGIRLRNARLSP